VTDLVDRDFTAMGPNPLWVAGITYVPTWDGFLFLATLLEVWRRRIVGWTMATYLRTELVLDALDILLERRKPREVTHLHSATQSDHGCPCTSLAFERQYDL